jgi:hypothetical protein
MKRFAVLCLAATSAFSAAQVWSGGGGAVPDGNNTTLTPGSFSSTINGVPQLSSISSIAILGLTHSWAGDLVAEVSGPAGTFRLFGRIGRAAPSSFGSPFGRSDDFAGNYVFVNTGGNNIWTTPGNPIPGGAYDASDFNGGGAASGMPGSAAAGNWTLTVSDWAGGDTGSFQGWEIRGQAVPEPATMAILGLGAAALIRRRRKA